MDMLSVQNTSLLQSANERAADKALQSGTCCRRLPRRPRGTHILNLIAPVSCALLYMESQSTIARPGHSQSRHPIQQRTWPQHTAQARVSLGATSVPVAATSGGYEQLVPVRRCCWQRQVFATACTRHPFIIARLAECIASAKAPCQRYVQRFCQCLLLPHCLQQCPLYALPAHWAAPAGRSIIASSTA